MIHFKLGRVRPVLPEAEDSMRHEWVGYALTLLRRKSCRSRNRGMWRLGRRAEAQRYAVFSALQDGHIRRVVEVSEMESYGDKRAVVGTVLAPATPRTTL